MKNYLKGLGLFFQFVIISFLLLFSQYSFAQRNVTTIQINGKTMKKKPIVDSLAEWMSRSDLRKADSCIQIIFNAVHRKDTAAQIRGIDGLLEIVSSKKYEEELSIPSYEGRRLLPGSLTYCDMCQSILCRLMCSGRKKTLTLKKEF